MGIHCPLLKRITLGLHKSDNNNRMIQLTDIFYVLLRYNGTSNIWLQYTADSIIRDPIMRRALYKRPSLFAGVASEEYPSNTKTAYNKELLFWAVFGRYKVQNPRITNVHG